MACGLCLKCMDNNDNKSVGEMRWFPTSTLIGGLSR